jgi:type I restriction enzyme M protein
MLDAQTKQRVDTLRDILVGKIPDPKSQIEQITIALIYKFMQDMDNEAVNLGGKASFFVEEYAKFSWDSLFSPQLGGNEFVTLYSEAMTEMNQNPHLPQLFRDIFKNAYLPFRDPETLRLFLKHIDDFSYTDDSETLGDAFEYLLSSLSTQGDAGQFRTPRHIIDFIVEVVNPQKDETILDPACGTAGFLISAYQYLMKKNPNLSSEELKAIYNNINGYDISPDMIRFSLVNLYLHQFTNPKIFEYDSLTSEDRWNEYYDVILANPPFMTPKGGIRPHNRFGVKSNRAEVLFVDYIAEHLTPTGRAGIIVPEGIIFQSANAYKSLRKTLVNEYLWAVVSLPAGVFQPYSGVKTSILFLDKAKAKNIDEIMFVEVKNDGYGLGSQRKPIDKNDLPEALEKLKEHDANTTS